MRTGPIRLKYISNKHNRTITENQTYDIMTICVIIYIYIYIVRIQTASINECFS